MNSRTMLTVGMTALAMVGTVATTQGLGSAIASTRGSAKDVQVAAEKADKAAVALRKGNYDLAVTLAEEAVAAQPETASYRVLLGTAYLKAGRFASARAALADALTLDPEDGKAALNFALAQIGTGDWAGAHQTLDRHAAALSAADRGLALALAGDPGSGLSVLVDAARRPDADAKLRQNLALTLALAGRWQDARSVAAMDLSPADVDKRMMQWAAFAQPKGAADQVAALLGAVPVVDSGLPQRLALVASAPAVAVQTPVEGAAPAVEQAAAQSSAAPTVAEQPPAPAAVAANAAPQVTCGPRQEVVQAVPVRQAVAPAPAPGASSPRKVVAAVVRPVAVATAAPAMVAPAKGDFFVQLGAYENAGVARDAWGRAKRHFAGFARQTPLGANAQVNGGSFYRLSVGGFARADAVKLCSSYRAKGGRCFVRVAAGEQPAKF